MFSLIIVILSAALVALLSAATLIYLGDTFGESASRSEVTRLVNEAQQISGALELFKADHKRPASSLQELVDYSYLAQIPEKWHSVSTYLFYTGAASDDACLAFNHQQNVFSIPSCSDPNYRNKLVS
ncbi:MAG: hypothetical protein P3W96_006390 [Halomonas sp.]|nr:hypothetical protein [Halomonas sp.]MDM7481631.1 hypothetical protein [Halomonas sp.]